MVTTKERPLTATDLQSDFEQAFASTTAKALRYEPPAVLTALTRLLIKPKRIAQTLKVTPTLVRTMQAGQQKTPEKYLPALYHLLRLAITAARGEIAKAEQKETMWGKFQFPESTLEFFRERIKEAEEVLAKEERGQ